MLELADGSILTKHVGWRLCPMIDVLDGVPRWRAGLALIVFYVRACAKILWTQPSALRYLLPHRCRAESCSLLLVELNGHQLLRVPNPGRWVTWT